MRRHSIELTDRIRILRSQGKTYGEINHILGTHIAKSTLCWMCKNTSLPKEYLEKITQLNIQNLGIARATSMAIRHARREEFANKITRINLPISKKVLDKDIAKIVLAILCLGEASKSIRSNVFCLGNTDHRIIELFIYLLRMCFSDFDPNRLRCTIQCRADQDIRLLEKYWQKITNIPPLYFHKTRIDPRTIGKPTLRKNYMGVLKVDYLDTKKQLELESLADLIYNQLHKGL